MKGSVFFLNYEYGSDLIGCIIASRGWKYVSIVSLTNAHNSARVNIDYLSVMFDDRKSGTQSVLPLARCRSHLSAGCADAVLLLQLFYVRGKFQNCCRMNHCSIHNCIYPHHHRTFTPSHLLASCEVLK